MLTVVEELCKQLQCQKADGAIAHDACVCVTLAQRYKATNARVNICSAVVLIYIARKGQKILLSIAGCRTIAVVVYLD